MKRTLALALALLPPLVACSSGDHGHEHGSESVHGHAHDEDGGHADAPTDAPTPAATPAPGAAGDAGPVGLKLGAWEATLEATGQQLRLVVTGPEGAVTPAGEARVVLTGTGEEEQRIVLSPGESAWTGSARAAGAAGYVAVVSVELDGRTESGRATWGDVPAPTSDHGHDHGPHESGDHEHDPTPEKKSTESGDHGHDPGDRGHDH